MGSASMYTHTYTHMHRERERARESSAFEANGCRTETDDKGTNINMSTRKRQPTEVCVMHVDTPLSMELYLCHKICVARSYIEHTNEHFAYSQT